MASEKAEAPAPTSSGFTIPRLIPTLPINMLNSINPFASTDMRDGKEPVASGEGGIGIPFLKRPLFGSILGRPTSITPASDAEQKNGQIHTLHDSTVMFAEPEGSDSDKDSREGSVIDERRRRRNKPKTSFSLCHPPPASTTRQKLHRKPRSLLQLHKLSPDARPRPAFEVIPSVNFSVKLVKAITKTYKAKHGLCPNDLVILKAERYLKHEEAEDPDVQDIVALICRGKTTETRPTRIIMSSGEEWEIGSHGCGGYDFSAVDDHGLDLTVRWVPKKSRDGKQSKDKRWNFSTIAPGTRKHPVIASLSSTTLEINDSYKVPAGTPSTPLSTPKNGDGFLTSAMEAEDTDLGDEMVTDDRLRELIAVTAIYVTFKEGHAPHFRYDEKEITATRAGGSPRKELDRNLSTPPASPAQHQMQMLEKRGSIRSMGSGILRRSSLLSAAHRDSTISVDSLQSIDTSTAAPAVRHGRSRSGSDATVLVHRATSNRRRANQQATWRPDLLHVQNSVPETSREDLTRVATDCKPKTKSSLANSANSNGPSAASDEHEPMIVEAVKRESSTTTDTTASEAQPVKANPKRSSTVRKSGRWRKLLSCMR